MGYNNHQMFMNVISSLTKHDTQEAQAKREAAWQRAINTDEPATEEDISKLITHHRTRKAAKA